jgi:hypothetical protein
MCESAGEGTAVAPQENDIKNRTYIKPNIVFGRLDTCGKPWILETHGQ